MAVCPYLKQNSVGVRDLKLVGDSTTARRDLHRLAASRHCVTACKLHMGPHNPSIHVPTGCRPLVIAQDEGEVVEDVCCTLLTEFILHSTTKTSQLTSYSRHTGSTQAKCV